MSKELKLPIFNELEPIAQCGKCEGQLFKHSTPDDECDESCPLYGGKWKAFIANTIQQ